MLIAENLQYLKSIKRNPTIFQKSITKRKSQDILGSFLSVSLNIWTFTVANIERYFEMTPEQDCFVFNRNNLCFRASDWVYGNLKKLKQK